MHRALLAVMAVVLVLIGPAMFVVSRVYAFDSAFAHIHPGETRAEVQARMGHPERQVWRRASSTRKELEYRYTVWPLSRAWVIVFAKGRVLAARRH